MQVKKQQLELDMEQQTGSKLGKEYIKRNAGLDETQAGINLLFPGETAITSDMQMTPPLW